MVADVSAVLHAGVLLGGAAVLVAAGLHDVAARTVPNLFSAMIAVCGIAARTLDGNLLLAIAMSLLVFFVAAFCWRRGWMGGGDVKLLAAAALLVPPASVAGLVIDVAFAGGILAITYLILYATIPIREPSAFRPRSIAARALRVERWRISRKGPIPYASAIAAGALFCLLGE